MAEVKFNLYQKINEVKKVVKTFKKDAETSGKGAYSYISGLSRSAVALFNMLPYVVTIVVLIITSVRNKKENQPPQSLGLAYFREER